MANMLVGEGQPDAAKAYFESVDKRMWNTQTELVYLNVLSQLGELPEEIKFNKDSKDTYYHANIGKLALRDAQFLEQLKRSPESIRKRQLFAIDRFRQSVEIEPTLVESWRFLIRALVDIGEPETAKKMISKAQLEIAEERAHIFLAQANEIVGNPSEALSHYKSHLQSQPDDVVALQGVATMLYTSGSGKLDEATIYVDRIINSDIYSDGTELKPRDREVRAWARRTKAQILTQANTYHDFDNALSIIEQNQDANGMLSPEDLLLYSKLAASRNDGVSQNKAIAKLEKIKNLAQRPLSRDEQVVLAELYKKRNRWDDCSSIMTTLLGNTPNDMKLLTPWLAWLLEADQVRSAEKWLENIDKRSLAYIRTRAHIWVKKGETKKATTLLQSLLPKDFKSPEDKAKAITLAKYMEQMGEDDPRLLLIVEKIWRKYVQSSPDESLRLAVFLGQQDDMQKIDEAFQVCEAAIKAGQAPQALQVAVSILRTNQDRIPAGSRQHQLVKRWYDAEEQSNPSAALRIQRSEFDGIMGDFDRAVLNLEKYRTDANVSPQQKAMANNNLAYILALQGKGQRALDLIDESVGILGPVSDLLDTRAMAHLALGRNNEALDDLNKAITFGGESAFKSFHLALAQVEAGSLQEAKESMRKAKELGLELNQLNLLEQKQFKAIEAALVNVDEERTEPVSTVGP